MNRLRPTKGRRPAGNQRRLRFDERGADEPGRDFSPRPEVETRNLPAVRRGAVGWDHSVSPEPAPGYRSAGEAEPPRVRRGAVALDDDDMETVTRSYHLLRDGVPGPEHPLTTLVAMVQRGDLRATDTLVHPLTQRRLKVIDVAELRVELGRAPMPAASHAIPIAAPVAQRPMMTQPERRSGGTFLWIAIATAAFAAAGAWLWWRANGG